MGLDTSEGKPKVKMTVVVTSDYLAITHGDAMLDSIPSISGGYDYASLSKQLSTRRMEIDIKDEVIVAVRDAIRFKYVVNVMDRCRNAGFEKVGLSSAPEETESL